MGAPMTGRRFRRVLAAGRFVFVSSTNAQSSGRDTDLGCGELAYRRVGFKEPILAGYDDGVDEAVKALAVVRVVGAGSPGVRQDADVDAGIPGVMDQIEDFLLAYMKIDKETAALARAADENRLKRHDLSAGLSRSRVQHGRRRGRGDPIRLGSGRPVSSTYVDTVASTYVEFWRDVTS